MTLQSYNSSLTTLSLKKFGFDRVGVRKSRVRILLTFKTRKTAAKKTAGEMNGDKAIGTLDFKRGRWQGL